MGRGDVVSRCLMVGHGRGMRSGRSRLGFVCIRGYRALERPGSIGRFIRSKGCRGLGGRFWIRRSRGRIDGQRARIWCDCRCGLCGVDVVSAEDVRGIAVALVVRLIVVGVTVDTETGDRLDNEDGEDRDVGLDAMVDVGMLLTELLNEAEDTVDALVGGTRDEIRDETNELLSDVYEDAKRLFVGA